MVGLCLLPGRNFVRLLIDVKPNTETELVSLAAVFRVVTQSFLVGEKRCVTTLMKLKTQADSIRAKLLPVVNAFISPLLITCFITSLFLEICLAVIFHLLI